MRKCAFGVISAIAYLIVGSCFNRLLALDFPEFGFRFRCETGVNLNGWECVGGGFYPKKRISPGTVVTSKNLEEFMECCVDTFYPFRKTNSENRFRLAKKVMLVRTKPLTHGSQGGIEMEEIIDWILVERKETEEFWTNCTLNDRNFELSVVDRRKKTLVGITVDETGFSQSSFDWRAFPCDIP